MLGSYLDTSIITERWAMVTSVAGGSANDDEGGSRDERKGRFTPEQIIGVLKQ
jgi:hypothetical protein